MEIAMTNAAENTPLKNREELLLSHRMIPRPLSFTLDSQELYRLGDDSPATIEAPGEILASAGEIFLKNARSFWNIRPALTLVESAKAFAPEGYEIRIAKDAVTISAGDGKGILNAMKTLRQLTETERGVLKYRERILPCSTILDAPALAFRGIHLCWFPETAAFEIEKQIRLAAYYKFNYAVIEPWGMFKSSVHPEMCWKEFAVDADELKRLVRLGRELGITLIPQLNLFGHAALSRCGSGKHVLLDFHPEFESLFEPDGWTWCISNPATRAFLTDLVLELHEVFERPEFFHIGCDEAYNASSCTSCRRSDYKQLLCDHITYFHDLFAQRGTRVMMWHDMLLNREDPRWNGYIVCGREKHGLTELYKILPKDIVICDWQYDYPESEGKEPHWTTSRFFQETGFDLLVCPWINARGTISLGKFAAENKCFGMLETTWHLNHGARTFLIYFHAAMASWSPEAEFADDITYREFMNRHLREISRDMGLKKYVEQGNCAYQVNPYNFQD